MRLRSLFVALALVSPAAPALAQTNPAPLEHVAYMRQLQSNIDALQRRLDLQQPDGAHVWIDGVTQTAPLTIAVQGWGFGCGFGDEARVTVVLDGIELPNIPARYPRPDVNAAFGCPVGPNPGITALASVAGFTPGTNGDHFHVVKLRVYPPRNWNPGLTAFKMVETSEWGVYVY